MSNENTIVFSDWLFISYMDYNNKKFIDLNKLKDIKSPNIPMPKYLGKVYIKEKNSAR